MEEGEIPPDSSPAAHLHGMPSYDHLKGKSHDGRSPQDISGAVYSPALEWPGDDGTPSWAEQPSDSVQEPPDAPRAPRPSSSPFTRVPASLRLLVQNSSIVPRAQTLVVVDGYGEVQFGRDALPPGADTPRVRLKEMEVSKLHATVYWDQERAEWAVVDMGSKHGTFLKASGAGPSSGLVTAPSSEAPDVGSSDGRGVRLSPPRVASVPRRLRHLDCLTIGSTTFVVHLHDDQIPCAACARREGKEISLFNVDREREESKKPKVEAANASPAAPSQRASTVDRDPKRALSMLRRSLLSRHESSPSRDFASQYVDRSAKRRALFPYTTLEPYRPKRPQKISTSSSYPASRSGSPMASAPTPPRSAPPAPLPETNVGLRLLMKQGWQPGTSLGQPDSSDVALVEPLAVSGNVGRAGLGMSAPASAPPAGGSTGDWKEDAKFRRWASLGAEDVAK